MFLSIMFVLFIFYRKLDQKEAEFLKLKSRYLWLLKEFSGPKRGESGYFLIIFQTSSKPIE